MRKAIQFLQDWRDCRTSSRTIKHGSEIQHESMPKILFWCGLLAYFAFLALIQPKWLLSGDMYNEMATNYYHFALSPTLYERLFSLDAGYIPLPQRLLALLGWSLQIPANSIPYFYTGSALLLTAALTLSFCAKRFRAVISDDYLRLFIALSALIVVDFESRTFINFSYFSVFFISIIAVLATVDTDHDVPAWAWVIPVLMLSKPAVLCAVPFMLLAALFSCSGRRFRYITIATLLVASLQIVQLMTSAKAGVMAYANSGGLSDNLEKIVIALKTFFSFLGAYVIGPDHFGGVNLSFYFGFFLFVAVCIILKKFRHPAIFMCICGIFLVFSSAVLNTAALPRYFDSQVTLLTSNVPLYRHTIVIFWGVLFIVAGLCVCIKLAIERFIKNPVTQRLSSIFFAIWFVLSGWLSCGITLSRDWWAPFVNNSQWQSLSASIQAGVTPLCVPIDPLYFVYGNNCKLLSPTVIDFDTEKKSLAHVDAGYTIGVPSPSAVSQSNLVAVALLAYPLSNAVTRVEAELNIELAHGKTERLRAERVLDRTGGMIYFSPPPKITYKDVKRIILTFYEPIEIAYYKRSKEPVILWMGTDFLPEKFENTMVSAIAGNAAAQADVAQHYELGNGVPLNLGEAFNWYMKSALQGNSEAQFKIGFAYRHGKGVQKNDAEALKWLKSAAEHGSVNAQSELNEM